MNVGMSVKTWKHDVVALKAWLGRFWVESKNLTNRKPYIWPSESWFNLGMKLKQMEGKWDNGKPIWIEHSSIYFLIFSR